MHNYKKVSRGSLRTLVILVTLFLSMGELTFAQENPRNLGLSEPQDSAYLPVSKAEIEWPTRKAKNKQATEFVETGFKTFLIEKGWELIEAEKTENDGAKISQGEVSTEQWYDATVPGTVLTTLVAQGVYPDPYFGINNLAIPDDLCRKDWWYYNEFPMPDAEAGERVWLLLNGINYEAHVWFNGQQLGSIKGAFIRGEYEITELLQETNHLAVHIIPPPHPGIAHEASARAPRGPNGGAMCQDGPTFLSSEGWDWVPTIRDRNIGIWQDVRLKFGGSAKMIDPTVIADLNLPDTSVADLTLKLDIESQAAGSFTLEGQLGELNFSKKIKLSQGTNSLSLSPEDIKALQIQTPKLWWPNGYGAPNLYYLTLTLKDKKKRVVDVQSVRFGIRELSYEFAVSTPEVAFQRIEFNPVNDYGSEPSALFDHINRVNYQQQIVLPSLHEGVSLEQFKQLEGDNPYLIIKVNGVPIFCKGGNWGMDDGMKRVSRERLEPYFKLHREAHYTMIRNWTGESTEEVFYELADEYGLLVWNDFWMSTEDYNLPPTDHELFMKNATDVVKRFRNHPSIALWCSRNEGYAPKGLDKPLADLIAQEDGTRMYQSNSRYLNLRPSGPWSHRSNLSFYFAQRAEGFSTEVGTQSFPTVESFQDMIPEEDLWPINDVWYYHDLHGGQEYFRANLIELYGEAFSLADFNRKAQLLNYRNHRAIFEAWNAKLWDHASGVLLWMTHPAWPSMIWQTYSWDYETYGAYYGAKKACEPVHIQLNHHDNKVLALNTTLKHYKNAKALAVVYDLEGNELQREEKVLDFSANAKTEAFVFKAKGGFPDPYLIRLYLHDAEGKLLSQNTYWRSNQWINKYFAINDLEDVSLTLKASVQEAEGIMKGVLTVSNPNPVAALNLKFNLRDAADNERVLPTYFSDGYFTLLPGEERSLSFEVEKRLFPESAAISVEGYNVPRAMVEMQTN